MTLSRPATAMTVAALALASGCVSTGRQTSDASTDASDTVPDISVTVPPERLTPFCETMITLSDRLLTEDVDDGEALIIATYQFIQPEVPPEISADFDAVLKALESGLPVPTDPPLPTTPTTVSNTAPTTASTSTTTTSSTPGSSVAANAATPTTEQAVDVGYASGHSPSERINNYVSLACRATQNNPGPPATQPLEAPPETTR